MHHTLQQVSFGCRSFSDADNNVSQMPLSQAAQKYRQPINSRFVSQPRRRQRRLLRRLLGWFNGATLALTYAILLLFCCSNDVLGDILACQKTLHTNYFDVDKDGTLKQKDNTCNSSSKGSFDHCLIFRRNGRVHTHLIHLYIESLDKKKKDRSSRKYSQIPDESFPLKKSPGFYLVSNSRFF